MRDREVLRKALAAIRAYDAKVRARERAVQTKRAQAELRTELRARIADLPARACHRGGGGDFTTIKKLRQRARDGEARLRKSLTLSFST